MAHIDLHLHTTFSDGALSPEALVASAAERQVTLIAVTDHDEIDGVAPAQQAGKALGINVISGVEINTEVGANDVHILGYGFPTDSLVLRDALPILREARVERLRKMIARLESLGYPLDPARVLDIAGHGSVGRPHLAQALVEAGHVRDAGEAFDRLIGKRKPAYVPRSPMTPEDAIALVHRAGGVASLAHPGKLGDPPGMVRWLVAAGLDALEAYHSDHLPATVERMRTLARNYHLAVTGGSDSHGPRAVRPVPVGAVPIPDEIGEQFLALLAERTTAGE